MTIMDKSAPSGQGEPEFYTLREAAQILRVSERTMRRYLTSGRAKGVNLGGLWRIPKAEIDRLKAPRADEELDQEDTPDAPYGEQP